MFHDAAIRTDSPLGAGSERSVLLSELTMRPDGRAFISVRARFDGSYPIAARFHGEQANRVSDFSGQNVWTKVLSGQNGPRVLVIECKEGHIEEPYGDLIQAPAASQLAR